MISALDLFTIGIGPSSSHTVGPMRAAGRFVAALGEEGLLRKTRRVRTQLYGSLGATGLGHGSDKAVLLGLEGEEPETIDTADVARRIAHARADRALLLAGEHRVDFDPVEDLVFHRRQSLPGHANALTFEALDEQGSTLLTGTYYSVGGGFVLDEDELGTDRSGADLDSAPYPFTSGR
jgi:L-serine dehydratase